MVPVELADDLAGFEASPLGFSAVAFEGGIAVTLLFTFALSFAYFLLYSFAALSLELDAER